LINNGPDESNKYIKMDTLNDDCLNLIAEYTNECAWILKCCNKLLHSTIKITNKNIVNHVAEGHLNIFLWIFDTIPIHFDIRYYAALHNQKEIYLCAVEHKFHSYKSVVDGAIEGGHLDMLVWLYEYRKVSINNSNFFMASKFGRIDILCWLKKNIIPIVRTILIIWLLWVLNKLIV
jgi:hypothetical protein